MNPHGASEVPEGWDVCHSGYLEKRSTGLLGGWKMRFFMLYPARGSSAAYLDYGDSENSAGRRSLALPSSTRVNVVPLPGGEVSVIEITTPSGNMQLRTQNGMGQADEWARALKGAISQGLGGASRAVAAAEDGDARKSSSATATSPTREGYSRQPSGSIHGFDNVQRAGQSHSPSRRSSAVSIPELESLPRAGRGYSPTKKYDQTPSPETTLHLDNYTQSGPPHSAGGIGAGMKVHKYPLVGGGSAPGNVSTDPSGGIRVFQGSDTDSSGASSSEEDEGYTPSKGADTSSVLKHYTSFTPRGGAEQATKPPNGVPTLALGGLLGGGGSQVARGVEGDRQSAHTTSNHSGFGGHGASGSPKRFVPGGQTTAPSNAIKPLAIAPIVTPSSGSAFKPFISPRASKMGSFQSPKVPAAPPPITPRSTRPAVTPRSSIPRTDPDAWGVSPRTDNGTSMQQQQFQDRNHHHHHHHHHHHEQQQQQQQQRQPRSLVEGDANGSGRAYAAWDERGNVPYHSSGSQTARLSTSLSSWGGASPRAVGDVGQLGMSGSMSARGSHRSGNDGSLSARGAPPVPVLSSELYRDEEPEEAQEIYTQNGTTYFRAATRVSPRNYKSFTARKFLQPDISDMDSEYYDEEQAQNVNSQTVKTTLMPTAITDMDLIKSLEEAQSPVKRASVPPSPQKSSRGGVRPPMQFDGGSVTPRRENQSTPRQQASSGGSIGAASLRRSTSALPSPSSRAWEAGPGLSLMPTDIQGIGEFVVSRNSIAGGSMGGGTPLESPRGVRRTPQAPPKDGRGRGGAKYGKRESQGGGGAFPAVREGVESEKAQKEREVLGTFQGAGAWLEGLFKDLAGGGQHVNGKGSQPQNGSHLGNVQPGNRVLF